MSANEPGRERRGNGRDRHDWWNYEPKWWRQCHERKHRARVRDWIAHERWDDEPDPPRMMPWYW